MPVPTAPITRRQALKQTAFFSAALSLGTRGSHVRATDLAGDDLHFLMIGDWGAGIQRQAQSAVAMGMKAYAGKLGRRVEGLFLVGDNFYGTLADGVRSARWKTDFEDMYPASVFPG